MEKDPCEDLVGSHQLRSSVKTTRTRSSLHRPLWTVSTPFICRHDVPWSSSRM